MDVAYIRDGSVVHTDETLILACLLHSKGTGRGRGKDDLTTVQAIMKDPNLDRRK